MAKNLRKIKPEILAKLESIGTNEIVATVCLTLKPNEINRLSHLNIALNSGGLVFPDSILPPALQGKCSQQNALGWEIKRTDLPKTIVSYSTREAPNWGGYGTHTVTIGHRGYPLQQFPPTLYTINVECANPQPNQDRYIIKFELNHVMDKTSDTFNSDLLYCLNILQENLGCHGVEAAGTPITEYINSLQVPWELLPVGNIDEAINRLFQGKTVNQNEIDTVRERWTFFASLSAENIIVGTSGFSRYYGAKINENLVVFDNANYGNAIYIMFQDWQTLSQRTRTELLSGICGTDFIRVEHREGWQRVVRKVIRQHRRQ